MASDTPVGPHSGRRPRWMIEVIRDTANNVAVFLHDANSLANKYAIQEFLITIQTVQVVAKQLDKRLREAMEYYASKDSKLSEAAVYTSEELPPISLLDKIYITLGEYRTMLEAWKRMSTIKRIFRNSRVRRKLERLNATLHSQVGIISPYLLQAKKRSVERRKQSVSKAEPTASVEPSTAAASPRGESVRPILAAARRNTTSADASKPESPQPPLSKPAPLNALTSPSSGGSPPLAAPSSSAAAAATSAATPASPATNAQPSAEERRGTTDQPISISKRLARERQAMRREMEDPAAKAMWDELFGADEIMVEWDVFCAGLLKTLRTTLDAETDKLLRAVLDDANAGVVSFFKFADFLKGFGPLQDCLENTRTIMTAPWFHGYLSAREAELLLNGQPAGTFLFRFSRSRPGHFALAVARDGGKRPLHILVGNRAPHGFYVEEQGGSLRPFDRLHDVVAYYGYLLKTPLATTLPAEPWFQGDITGEEAAELLKGCPPGTFLVRFSVGNPGCFVAQYVTQEGKLRQSLIEPVNAGFKFSTEQRVFPNLRALVVAYSHVLQIPLKTIANLPAEAVAEALLTDQPTYNG